MNEFLLHRDLPSTHSAPIIWTHHSPKRSNLKPRSLPRFSFQISNQAPASCCYTDTPVMPNLYQPNPCDAAMPNSKITKTSLIDWDGYLLRSSCMSLLVQSRYQVMDAVLSIAYACHNGADTLINAIVLLNILLQTALPTSHHRHSSSCRRRSRLERG